ncbi:MAG TPA: uroporphyrinogen-III synthase [Xanthobacteraceae bacterium]
MRLLVTRPEPDGARTGEALRTRGHAVLLAPLLRVEAIDCDIPDAAYGAVVMTSANAARAIASHPRRAALTALPAFAVGRRSADAARAAGFRDVRSADGDKADLLALLRAQYQAQRGPFLYLAGEDRAGEIDLAASGVEVVTAVVYRAVAAERFPDAVAAALGNGEVDGVLHLSRRSAQAYLACARRAGLADRALAPLHFCLSRAVAEPLAAAGAAAIRIAHRPDEAAMLELVGSP